MEFDKKRVVSLSEIEGYFLKWTKLDHKKTNHISTCQIRRHLIERERKENGNDISYLNAGSNILGYESVMGRILKKHRVKSKVFTIGCKKVVWNAHDKTGDYEDIKRRWYALLLV